MRFGLSAVSRGLAVLISAIMILTMLSAKPVIIGDGLEYLSVMVAIIERGEVQVTLQDIREVQAELSTIPGGFVRAADGAYYAVHFWFYSFICVPVKILLTLLHADILKTMQVTNAIIFAALLGYIAFLSTLPDREKLLAIVLISVSPAVWYVHWTHPEVYLFALVWLSLIFHREGKHACAIAAAAFASLQNSAIVVLVIVQTVSAILKKRAHAWRYLAIMSLASIPFLWNLLIFHSLRTFLLMAGVHNISLRRAVELLLDPNIGLLVYVPLLGMLSLFLVFSSIAKNRNEVYHLCLVGVLGLMALVCSSVHNWNHGSIGPSRYVIWMCPLLFFPIVGHATRVWKSRGLSLIFGVGVITQVLIILSLGGFMASTTHLEHTPVSAWLIEYVPSWYNPSFEIFSERTLHREAPLQNLTLYQRAGICRKALVQCSSVADLARQCSPKEITCKTGWIYVNY